MSLQICDYVILPKEKNWSAKTSMREISRTYGKQGFSIFVTVLLMNYYL